MNFMNDNGKQMKGIKGLTIVNGVMLTTTSLVTLIVKNLIPTILIADSVIRDVILVGDQRSSIVSHVLMTGLIRLIMNEELFVQLNVGMESCL